MGWVVQYNGYISKSIIHYYKHLLNLIPSSQYYISSMLKPLLTLPLFLLLLITITVVMGLPCSHDNFAHEHPKIFMTDLSSVRLLQSPESGRLRIFVDYSQVSVGSVTEINTIKRVMNITASYFYNVLNVTRLPQLFFPTNQSLQCSLLKVPSQYVTQGAIGDVGILCGNEQRADAVYIAKSVSCVHLESTKRPVWGMVMWNNYYLKFDQEGFQEILFVGMHEMTHVLGFSASMYEMYPKGNPLVQDDIGNYYLTSPDIQRQIRAHFNCSTSKGLPLEDQDGTLVASHWQRKVMGNEYMIATNKKNSLVSIFTLALLNSTGWYTSVNSAFAEPTLWGRNKSCSFMDIDNCAGNQFCTDNAYQCDFDGTGIGKCDVDAFTGSCQVPKYFTNTICVDENFQAKNLNSGMNALERGGSTSRCFVSDFRSIGLSKTILNNRCYVTMCSATGRSLFVLVGPYIVVCSRQGQIISAPIGLTGTLTCPRSFANYCQGKKTCPYHCNKNGACINGRCMCTGDTFLSSGCADVSIFTAPVGNTGGLVNAFKDQIGNLDLGGLHPPGNGSSTGGAGSAGAGSGSSSGGNPFIQRQQIRKYSINSKCIQGTTYDKLFGECLKCQEVFRCDNCDDSGCISCDNGKMPTNGVC